VTAEGTEPPTPPEPGAGRVAGGPALPVARRRTKRRLLAVFGLLAAAFVFLLVEGLGSSLNYYDTVSQALTRKDNLGTATFRLQGYVVPGSIRPTAVGTDFDITQDHKTVFVANTGSPPQLFQPKIGVVVQGHFASTNSTNFISDQILVKHSVNYAPAPAKTTAGKKTVAAKKTAG